MKIRRTYTREFKLQIVRECENSKAMAQLSRQHSIHPSLITRWKKEYREDPENTFSGKWSDDLAKQGLEFLSLQSVASGIRPYIQQDIVNQMDVCKHPTPFPRLFIFFRLK